MSLHEFGWIDPESPEDKAKGQRGNADPSNTEVISLSAE